MVSYGVDEQTAKPWNVLKATIHDWNNLSKVPFVVADNHGLQWITTVQKNWDTNMWNIDAKKR